MTADSDKTARARSVVRTRVRFDDTDLMGIVHHANYLSYMELGRIEWLRRRGIAYAEWAARGIHLPVVEVNLRYRAPARFDDEIDVETTLAEVRVASLRFDYRIVRVSDGVLCVQSWVRLALVDEKLALRRIPPEIADVLARGEIAGTEP